MEIDETLLEQARKLHQRAIVIDAHVDTTQFLLDPKWDFTARHDTGHVDLPRLREGGVSAVFFAVFKQGPLPPGDGPATARSQMRLIHELMQRYGNELRLARRTAEIRDAFRTGRIALLIGIEGGYLIENSLDMLHEMHRLGATYMTLTHGFHTDWADSSGIFEDLAPRHGGRVSSGLNAFGRTVVREMNRIGMMIDVSHVSDQTFWHVLETSTAPVVATHSSCRTISPHRRNLSDDMLRAIAQSGGVAHLNVNPAFIDPTFPQPKNDAHAHHGQPPPHATPLDRLADHFEHALQLIGPDHVGIGTDFDGIRAVPVGLEDCSHLPHLTAALLARGYSEPDLTKVLGENTLRVMDACATSSSRASHP